MHGLDWLYQQQSSAFMMSFGGWRYIYNIIVDAVLAYCYLMGIGAACVWLYYTFVDIPYVYAVWRFNCLAKGKEVPYISRSQRAEMRRAEDEKKAEEFDKEQERRQKMVEEFITHMDAIQNKQYDMAFQASYKNGYSQGYNSGHSDGYSDGYNGK